jgi:hypothetical protein
MQVPSPATLVPSPAKTESVGRSASTPQPAFTLKEISLICWALFAALLAAPLAIVVKDKIQTGRLLQEERDFVFFYGMGRMLNHYPPSQLYDFELQKQVDTEILPLKNGRQYTPAPYPPFTALLFRPLARLPYSTAYPLWLSITFLLYIFGLTVSTDTFFPKDLVRRSLVFCLALSFLPFWWIMMGGQIPIVGFIAFALAFREENQGRPFLSGLALSACLYKPTFLVLLLPMLLVTRRYRTLLGFAGGALAMTALTTAFEGVGIWSGYLRMQLAFGSDAAHGNRVLHYYMDLPAFSSLLPGGRSWLVGAALLAFACRTAFSLFQAWRRHADSDRPVSTLLWATTLTWTFVLNIYVPIYDSIVPIVAVIATAAALRDFPDRRLRVQFSLVWILILLDSWVAGPFAAATGVQTYTVLFALLGTVQLSALRKMAAAPLSDHMSVRLSSRALALTG